MSKILIHPTEPATHFHSFTIIGVMGVNGEKKGDLGWRIVALWGDEDKFEGNTIGRTFKFDELEECERIVREIEVKYGLPVEIHKIVEHFTGIGIGKKIDTNGGTGIVLDTKQGDFNFLVELENGTKAWTAMKSITKVYE